MSVKIPASYFTSIVRNLPSTIPFVGPEALVRKRGGRPFRARLGANESAFGPSPKAIWAMREAAAEAWMYGDPEHHDLKSALAAHHGIKPENIAVGAGIDTLFGYTVRGHVEPGDAVVTSLGAYPTFIFHVAGYAGRLVRVPYRGDREDWPALLEAAKRERARIVYLANPDNPMGSWWPASDIQQIIAGLPDDTVLVLDEAYVDTAPADAIPPLDVSDPRVLRFRTFSKAYGLAGARVGYVIGAPETIGAYDKIRDHFCVGRIPQAGALAALADQAYLSKVVEKIAEARQRLSDIAAANGLEPLPSATNFVAIDCGRDGGFATRVLDGLLARDVFVRMPGVAPLNRCIRVGTGLPAALDVFAEALPAALAAAR